MTPPEWLVPTWPTGTDAWIAAGLLLLLGAFKMDRGRILHRRARYFDRLGISIIAFDYTLGSAFVVALAWSLYPGLYHRYAGWALDAAVLTVMLWHWYEVRRADRHRIERAISPVAVDSDRVLYEGPDRREPGVPGRRGADR